MVLFRSLISSGLRYRFYYLIICAVLQVGGQQFEGDNCTVGENDGTCKIISSCPSAVKNLSDFGQRPQICGFKKTTPIVCCLDDTNSENNTEVQNSTEEIKSQNNVTSITNVISAQNNSLGTKTQQYLERYKDLVNTTGESTGLKAQQKCLEYSKYIYEWKLPENETDPNKKIKINNCAHIAAPLFIGSETTSTREFPHMALLGYRDEKNQRVWHCAGNLISEEFVLTAAHCTYSRSNGKVRWVRLGEQSIDVALESETQDFGVEEIIVHPGFTPPVAYNDIALLRLDRTATLNKFVIPACLHVGHEIKEKNVIVTGWGAPAFGETGRLDLAKRVLELFPNDECNKVYTERYKTPHGIEDSTLICEGHRTEEKGSCQGDSGGPVQVYLRKPYCMYDIIGITSFGKGCNIPGIPGGSTRVSAYISWIESIVWPDS